MILDKIMCNQPWCYSIEYTNIKTKILLVINITHLKKAQQWVDKQLPAIYSQNINGKIDVTMLCQMTPQCLDKPILMAATTAYAKTLQQRTSTVTMTTEHSKQLAKLPCAQKNVTGQSHIWQKRIPTSSNPDCKDIRCELDGITHNPDYDINHCSTIKHSTIWLQSWTWQAVHQN